MVGVIQSLSYPKRARILKHKSVSNTISVNVSFFNEQLHKNILALLRYKFYTSPAKSIVI